MIRNRILLVACLLSLAVTVCAVDVAPTCSWASLGFNPWERWNAFSFGSFGGPLTQYTGLIEGRVAAAGDAYIKISGTGVGLHEPTAQPGTTVWSGSFGSKLSFTGGSVGNGGLEAGTSVYLKNTVVADGGNVYAVQGPVTVDNGVQISGEVRAPSFTVAGGSNVAGGTSVDTTLSLSVNFAAVQAYFEAQSTLYKSLADTPVNHQRSGFVLFGYDRKFTLAPGINVFSLSKDDLFTTKRIALLGDPTGILIINVGGSGFASLWLGTLGVYTDNSFSVRPTGNRLLLNFHSATGLGEVGNAAKYFTVLAPKAIADLANGEVFGNFIALCVTDIANAAANLRQAPWNPEPGCIIPPSPPTPTPPTPVEPPPSPPGTGQETPSPPEPPTCLPCPNPWNNLSYNPWTRWNVFSLGDIGAPSVPFGGNTDGRIAARNNVWLFKTSVHTAVQPAGTSWSISAGGDFTLWGGSVFNGGVEAFGNVVIHAADVSGDVLSVNGNAEIGTVDQNVLVSGQVRAKGTATVSPQSTVNGGVTSGDATLTLSADLGAAADYFKKQSAEFAAATTPAATLTAQSNQNDIIVQLVSGPNYLKLSAAKLQKASRLRLDGPADSYLIINVAGGPASQDPPISFDSLDVYVNGWSTLLNAGRVLINYHQAELLHVTSGSGAVTFLAPFASVYFKQGGYQGNWVVGNLYGVWTGGTSIGSLPWGSPCSGCGAEANQKKTTTFHKQRQAETAAADRSTSKFAQQSRPTNSNNHQQKSGFPEWALAAGGAVAGVALSALVVAGVTMGGLPTSSAKNARQFKKPFSP